jgi:hypothetical protein
LIFEVGKFSRHTDIENYPAVRGRLPTTQNGETMIAEVWPNYLESFMAVGQDEAAAVNYGEIRRGGMVEAVCAGTRGNG